jgi:hypothetical protein
VDEPTPVSFSKDIRPLFTDLDVEHMKPKGIDLSNPEDVSAHADAIYRTVRSSGGNCRAASRSWNWAAQR